MIQDKYSTDWLASTPVFYNEKTKQISTNINDVIDFDNFDFHEEGLNNYLDFGYSVFEQTPIRYVKFLKHSSHIKINGQGEIEIINDEDPVDKWFGRKFKEADIIELLFQKVQRWESEVEGEIIIPTSGGYDSRLLNLLIKEKSRIRAFTYGVTAKQSDSYEVLRAKELARRLGLSWKQIFLGDYHQYFDEWDKIYGIAVHAHGMYQIEFYNKIIKEVHGSNPLLSGIFGDVWAGSINYKEINSFMDLDILGYTHGLKADKKMSKLDTDYFLRKQYYDENLDKLKSIFFQIISTIRLKIILISYLIKVPLFFGFHPWSPFLDIDIALGMLCLDENRRKDRIWQKDFFKKFNLDLDHINNNNKNFLNHYALKRVPLYPLDIKVMSEIIDKRYIEWINSNLMKYTFIDNAKLQMINIPKLGRIFRKAGLTDRKIEAYYAYLVLKPLENVIKRRESVLKKGNLHNKNN